MFFFVFFSVLKKQIWKLMTHKWPFLDHFGNCFANYIKIFHKTEVQMVILRCLACLNLSWIKRYDLICGKIYFCHAWKGIILRVFCQSEFWHLRTKSALIFLKWLIQRHNIPHFKGLGMRNLQYEKKIAKNCIIQAQWQNIFTIFLSGTDVSSLFKAEPVFFRR